MPNLENADRLSPARRSWCLAAIIVLGAALRLWDLGAQSLWYDEAASVHYAGYAGNIGALFDAKNNTEPPLLAVLTHFWMSTAGALFHPDVTSPWSDFLIRLLPCLFGIATIPLLFWTARALLRDDAAALLAALLFAVSPFHVYYAHELRIYTVYLFLSVAALGLFWRALESGRWRYWAGLALCEALMMYSHFISVWTIFLINAFFVLTLPAHTRRVGAWYLSQAVAGVLMLPALWQMFGAFSYVRLIEIPWYPGKPTWKTGLITFKDLFAGYGFTIWAYWAVFLLAAALCVSGLWALRRNRRAAFLLLLLAVAPVAVNIVMWSRGKFSFYEHRVFMFSGVVALCLAAAGLRALPFKALRIAVTVVFLALSVPGLRDLYAQRLHPIDAHRLGIYDKGDFRGLARYVRANWQDGDLLCNANHFTTYSLRHYLDHAPVRLGANEWDRAVLARSHGNEALLIEHDLMPQPMGRATQRAKRIWFVESQGITFEYKPHTEPVRAWLDNHFDKKEQHEFFGLSLSLYARREAALGRPNVVFLLVDTVRADHLGAARNGVPLTPNLDRFAAQAVNFADTIAPCSWTKPSMASIFTSLHVDAHKVLYSARLENPDHPRSDVLPGALDTITEKLVRLGYDAFGIQTNANLTRAIGFAQGFAEPRYMFENGARADWVTAQALRALDGLGRPYLLYGHYMDPHAPYDPPEGYAEQRGPMPELTEQDKTLLDADHFMAYYLECARAAIEGRERPESEDLSPAGKEMVKRLYDGEIRYLDEQVAPLLDRITREEPNTIVIIAADHGEEFWEHGGMGHGTALFNEQIRVPFLIKAPGVAPRVVTEPATLLDLVPTLAGLVRLEPDPTWQGRNLLDGNAPPPDMQRFSRTYGPWPLWGIDVEAVVQGTNKFLRNNRLGIEQLFDLAVDPAERNDLAAGLPGESASLGAALEQRRTTDAAWISGIEQVRAPMTEEDRRILEGIGYLEP